MWWGGGGWWEVWSLVGILSSDLPARCRLPPGLGEFQGGNLEVRNLRQSFWLEKFPALHLGSEVSEQEFLAEALGHEPQVKSFITFLI